MAGSDTDTKAVHAALSGGDTDRLASWADGAMEALRARGRSAGLTDFLDEVERLVVTLLVGERR